MSALATVVINSDNIITKTFIIIVNLNNLKNKYFITQNGFFFIENTLLFVGDTFC